MTLRQTSLAVITLIGVAMVASTFFVSTGFLLIDEVIYMASADTFLDTGQFVIRNGYETYGSEEQTWFGLLSIGPHGLTSQYPVGSAVVGGAFVALFDEHGFYVMNGLAAVATLFVTRALAIDLFEDERVALGAILLMVFGSYFTEYAFGLWPHMVSVLSVTVSFWLFLRASRADRPIGVAILSGLTLGAGLLFRVDGVLLLPTIGLLGILYAVKPTQLFVGGALGLMPGFLAMSYANFLKFGTWNPISYGGDSANEDPLKYLALIGVSVIGLLVAMAVRTGALRPSRLWLLALLAAGGVGALLVPQLSHLAGRLGHGITALIIDATATIDPRPGVAPTQNGTLLFWGLPKKAMGQSLPWLGCLCVLLFWAWGESRRAITCILVFAAIWMFPFVIRSWHGGLSLNMRYFLPVLPALCILAAWILKELMRDTIPRYWVFTVLAGAFAAALWSMLHPSGIVGAHQILPTYVFLLICAASLAVGLIGAKARALALICIALGIGQSAYMAATDNLLAQAARSDEMLDFTDATDKDVVYDVFVRSVLRDPNQIFALPHWANTSADPAFVAATLSDGYRVLMLPRRAERFIKANPQFQVLDDLIIQDLAFQSIGVR